MTHKCDECRRVAGPRGFHGGGQHLCRKCFTTPYDIRQREIHGCLSIRYIADRPRQERARRAAMLDKAGASVHRGRFHVVTGGAQ